MALETGVNIGDLVITNPTATDPKASGDDHLRLIKTVLRNSFAGFTGEIQLRGTEAQGATVNDYTVTVSPAPTVYNTGEVVLFKATHANTAGATLQINSLGTKSLLDVDGNAVVANTIQNGSLCAAYYNGTAFQIISANGHLKAPTPTVGDSSTKIATTAFVAATAFSSALPGQSTNAGKFLTTDGSAASWGDVAPAFPSGTTLAGFIQSAAPTGWTKVTTYNDCSLRIVSGTVTTGGTVNFSTAFSGASTTADGTAISTAQMPSHAHTINDAGHNHTFVDPGHAHSVSDPGHAHTIYDPGHNHTVNDPGHNHTITDPGHTHNLAGTMNLLGTAGTVNTFVAISSTNVSTSTTGIGINARTTGVYLSGTTTGIGINGSGTSISIYGASTGAYNATGYTGISVASNGSGATHTHGLSNLAVKYVDAIVCVKN